MIDGGAQRDLPLCRLIRLLAVRPSCLKDRVTATVSMRSLDLTLSLVMVFDDILLSGVLPLAECMLPKLMLQLVILCSSSA